MDFEDGEIKDAMKAAMFTLAQHMPELCAISVWRINGVTCIEIVCEGEVKRVQYMEERRAEAQARTH